MLPYSKFATANSDYVAFNPISYLKESRAELGNVIWPTVKETMRLTIVVLALSLLVGAYIAGLDAIFTSLVETFLR